ncbi:hypothetical protein BKA66DRAFT_467623 [Pyrenochaeta sp. MPI-SDFR-AT-0127]|nr:hypothetical protein BKA66DRAFT_467623 [Pyrenochaeta sp. MPI-SDFR-AT-0127]
MWKRLFCRCCTFASPKITTAPWAPASGFMFAPSLSLNSPPISAPSAEVQNTEEKLKILGDTIIAPTTLTDRPKKPKWWQRKHTASRKPKNGRLRKKYPNAQ